MPRAPRLSATSTGRSAEDRDPELGAARGKCASRGESDTVGASGDDGSFTTKIDWHATQCTENPVGLDGERYRSDRLEFP